jgi:hypothetical protein
VNEHDHGCDQQGLVGFRDTARAVHPQVFKPLAELLEVHGFTSDGPGSRSGRELSRTPGTQPVSRGGEQSLDGLSWDLAIDQLWEGWVGVFANDLAMRLGMVRQSHPRKALYWSGSLKSMASLAPDVFLRSPGRVVWIDAKYKPHVSLLLRQGWSGLSEEFERLTALTCTRRSRTRRSPM